MGAFYGSVHLRTSDRAAVHKALTKITKKKKACFLMGPVLHGWLPVYPDNSGQDDAMAKAIARGFSCEVLHVLVHDDDIFAYTFFRGGRPVDQFNSQPDYFDEVSARVRTKYRGRPELLADLVPDQRAVTELQEILNEARDAKVFATDSLDHFAKLLGLPNAVSSYEYLMEGETASIEGWDQYVHVPDRSAEVAQQERAEAGVMQAKEKLQAAGLLLAEQSAEHPAIIAAWCPDRQGSGFLVAWINPVNGIGPVPIKHLAPPWTQPPNVLGLVVSNNGHRLILSPSGRYLAIGGSHGTQLWDIESSTLVHEHSDKRAVGWMGFTPDEKHLITVAQQEVVVQSVLTGQQESSFAIPHADRAQIPNRAAVHPDGQMVIADPAGRLYLVDYLSAKVHKTMYLGGRHVAAAEEAAFLNTYWQQMDVETMVAKVRANMEQRIHAMEKRQQQTPTAERDAIEGMRRDMEKNLASLRQQFEQKRKRLANPIERAREQAYQMTISAEGQWLFCAGSGGLRVYSWKEICASDEPVPAFSIDPEPLERKTLQGTFPVPGFIHALTHDDRANRLLFGGGSGMVHFLDLASGTTGVVLDPPGRGPIRELGLSRDRSALLCMSGGKTWEDSGQRVALLQVWNYAKLAGRPMATNESN